MSDADKPELRQANDNPWYCLATLYGEQPTPEGAMGKADWDNELAAKNRIAWNRWIAGGLSSEQRATLVKTGFPEPDLVPYNSDERIAICNTFASRAGREGELPPDPATGPDFSCSRFDNPVNLAGFLFSLAADFRSATFSGWVVNFKSATFSGFANFGSATFSGSFALFG